MTALPATTTPTAPKSGSRLQLKLAALLFFGWLTWLGYLALTSSNPTVVSRLQMAQGTHFVLVQLPAGEPPRHVAIAEVLQQPASELVTGSEILVLNFPKEVKVAGTHFLPLIREKQEKAKHIYRVAPLAPQGVNELPVTAPIYPWNAEVQTQVKRLLPKRD